MKTKKIFALILLISAILILNTGCMYFIPYEKSLEEPTLMRSNNIVINSVPLMRGYIEEAYTVEGKFIPDQTETKEVECEVSGNVKSIYVSKGEVVKKGQLIAELDTEIIDEQVLKQQYSYENAKLDYEETKRAYEKGVTDKYDVEFKRINLQSTLNYLNDLKEKQQAHYIYSPDNGTVVNVYKGIGDNGKGKVADICKKSDGIVDYRVDTSSFSASAELPPEMRELLYNIEIGQEVKLNYKGNEYDGIIFRDNSKYVREVSYEPEIMHTQAKFNNMPDEVAFESPVDIKYVKAKAENALLIPISSVYASGKEYYTYVVENNEIIMKYIEVGVKDNVFYEVVSGLEEGERILKSK